MLSRLDSPQQLATHDEVEQVPLATTEVAAADGLVQRVLGALAHAAPAVREAVGIFMAAQYTASLAAEPLYIHPDTLLRRLTRADELLP
ncbi:hypothetical protein DMH26_07535 [Streptomyces sp. WAC 05379]|nr:hypothetical protein DMH26_07535 [Streptomyces sp. WAC 05379]